MRSVFALFVALFMFTIYLPNKNGMGWTPYQVEEYHFKGSHEAGAIWFDYKGKRYISSVYMIEEE